ncbi:MAG: AIR synthase related protein [Bacteroidota bacterium]
MKNTYGQRGVSAGKEDVHFAIRNLGKGLYPNAFAKVLPDMVGGDEEWCNIMHADGTGTKSSLAYIYWKETGDISVWKNLAQDALVMNLDDMVCVGATDQFIFSNTIGRNAFHISREVLSEILMGMESFFEMLRSYGIEAVNSGGETADVGDLVRTIIYDATAFSRMKRADVITNDDIAAGQVIIGLSSYGQAVYEDAYNSGIGSNGLTNGRHDMLHADYRAKYPESFDANIPDGLAYSGKWKLTDQPDGFPLDVGKMLLSPTRTYLPVMKKILSDHRSKVKGLIHCTGGGQTKCMKFVENLHVVKDNLFEIPPIFSLIQETSQADWAEMFKVFNMGHRLEIFCDPADAEVLLKEIEPFGIEAQIIGRCEAAEENKLSIQHKDISLTY